MLVSDLVRAARRGAAFARSEFRELRRRARESSEFTMAADKAERIRGWLSRAEGELLFHLAKQVPADNLIVEIGSFLGRSAAYLGQGASVPVYAVDPHSGNPNWTAAHGITAMDTSEAFRQNMTSLGLNDRVRMIVATSADAAENWDDDRQIGLLFVDGYHTAEAVHLDGSLWLPRLAHDGVAIFDDWAASGVAEGIARLREEGLLPPVCHGFVGKDLVFGPEGLTISVRLRKLR